MQKTSKNKLKLDRETVRALSKFDLTRVAGGSDNSECYCPGYTDPNSCVAMCGI
jgi:natural product precursor